jgi:hypothetical protein
MACEVEDVHDAFPDGLAAKAFLNWNGLDHRRRATMLRFNGPLQLIGLSFDHIDHVFTAIEASVFWRSTISAIVHSEASAICLVGTYRKNGFFVWKSALFAVELSLARIKHPGGCQSVATTKAGQKTESLTSEQRGHQGRLN